MGSKKPFETHRINIHINRYGKVNEVRLVDGVEEDEKGVCSFEHALELAKEKGLDLIEINSKTTPPICKIADYKKFLYNSKKEKKDKLKKDKQKQQKIKEIRFGPNTDEHDYNFKKKHAIGFLEDGNKVKAFVFFKGREIQHKEKGQILLLRFVSELEDYGIPENLPKMEGNRMVVFIKPKKK